MNLIDLLHETIYASCDGFISALVCNNLDFIQSSRPLDFRDLKAIDTLLNPQRCRLVYLHKTNTPALQGLQ